MNLRVELQETLDSALFELGIHSHWKRRKDDVGNEHVIYLVVSTPYTDFANNKPIRQEHNVDINYYALSTAFDYSRIELIKRTMFDNGWSLTDGESDIPDIDEKSIDGIHMEFTREVAV